MYYIYRERERKGKREIERDLGAAPAGAVHARDEADQTGAHGSVPANNDNVNNSVNNKNELRICNMLQALCCCLFRR